jgi:hypothetical protein
MYNKDSSIEIFFLTGFGKSGTTWMQHVLNKKKEIVCRGEGRFVAGFRDIYPSIYDLIKPGISSWYKYHSRRKNNWVGLDDYIVTVNNRNFILNDDAYNKEFDSDMSAIIEAIINHFASKYIDKDTLAIGDKTPINYVGDFYKLISVFSDKKIIVMQRDLPSVFLSRIYGWWVQNSRAAIPEKSIHPHFEEEDYIHTNKFLEGQEDYITIPETVIKFSETYCKLYSEISKYSKKNPELVKIVSFSSIIDDPVETLIDVIDFIGIKSSYKEIGKIVESSEKGKIKELSGNINNDIDFSDHGTYLSSDMLKIMNRMMEEHELE